MRHRHYVRSRENDSLEVNEVPHTVSLSLSTDLDHGPQFNFKMELRPEHISYIIKVGIPNVATGVLL